MAVDRVDCDAVRRNADVGHQRANVTALGGDRHEPGGVADIQQDEPI
jgi:hypothetical protein